MASSEGIYLFSLRQGTTLLLVLSLWADALFRLYGRKFLGFDLQRSELDLSRLRSYP